LAGSHGWRGAGTQVYYSWSTAYFNQRLHNILVLLYICRWNGQYYDKKRIFFWPLGPILRGMGAVPVDRSHGAISAKQIIETMQKAKKMHLAIAPEGTRKKTAKWKTGFHTIARACDIPIYLGFFDWSKKEIGRGVRFIPTENAQEDLKKIRAHYKAMNMEGCHPGHFDCGDVEPKLIEEQKEIN
jgi:1-acyl-sn-glycerol-3-phosphate acyltransferase